MDVARPGGTLRHVNQFMADDADEMVVIRNGSGDTRTTDADVDRPPDRWTIGAAEGDSIRRAPGATTVGARPNPHVIQAWVRGQGVRVEQEHNRIAELA